MSKLTRRAFVGTSLAGAGCLPSLLAVAEEALPPATELPSAQRGPVSAIRPGTRVIWLGAAASIPGDRSQIVPDPDGTWINRQTGQRYREFETPGPAGAGFTVADVQSVAGSNVLSWTSSLLLHTDQGNATTFIDADGVVSSDQNIGDFWIAPAKLATFADRNEAGVRVMHAPYSLGGRSYRALRTQIGSGGGWSQNTYDLDTGLLLVGSSTAQGSPTLVRGPGNVISPGAGSTQMSFTQIAGMRQTNLPGPGSSYPAAIRQLRALTYMGSRGTVMAGTQVPPVPLQVRYDIAAQNGSYLVARTTLSSPLTGNDVRDRTFPAGVIGSLWMNPEVLARLGANQTLDLDQVAGVQTMSLGRQGNVVLVAFQSRLARQIFGYDLQNGLLTSAEQQQQVGPATDVLSMRLAGTQ